MSLPSDVVVIFGKLKFKLFDAWGGVGGKLIGVDSLNAGWKLIGAGGLNVGDCGGWKGGGGSRL